MMEVVVKYADFNEVIKEVEIPINTDQREVMTVLKSMDDGVESDKVQRKTIDDTISFEVVQDFTKQELRDYVQVLQKFLMQMSK